VVVPLLPLPTIVPAFGVFDVTWEVLTGLVVVQVRLTLQLFAPAAMVHEGDESVPDICGAWQVLPFHVVPDAQLEVAVLVASCTALL
jgi:hypothetical protein